MQHDPRHNGSRQQHHERHRGVGEVHAQKAAYDDGRGPQRQRYQLLVAVQVEDHRARAEHGQHQHHHAGHQRQQHGNRLPSADGAERVAQPRHIAAEHQRHQRHRKHQRNARAALLALLAVARLVYAEQVAGLHPQQQLNLPEHAPPPPGKAPPGSDRPSVPSSRRRQPACPRG